MDFNNPSSFPAGTIYSPANDSVYYFCGFTVFTKSFYLKGINGTPVGYYKTGNIIPAPAIFGSGQAINLNNIALIFTCVVPIRPVTVTMEYLATDTIQNLSVNGNLYIRELKGAPSTLGGVTVNVTSAPAGLPSYSKKGTLILTGTVKEFVIGGREFFLDDVCIQ
jgi:hypothetical protein